MREWRLSAEVPLPKVTQLLSAGVWLQATLCLARQTLSVWRQSVTGASEGTVTVPVPWPPALGGGSVLGGRCAAPLARFETVPLPAPSFRRSREVFACSPAEVSDGENAVGAGEQMRGQGSGLCPPSGPRLLKIKPLLPESSGLSHNVLPQVFPGADGRDMPRVHVLPLVPVPQGATVQIRHRNMGPS